MRALLLLTLVGCAHIDPLPSSPHEEHISSYGSGGFIPHNVTKTLLGSSGVDLRAPATNVPAGTNFGGCTFDGSGNVTCTSFTSSNVSAINLGSTGRITWGGGNYITNSAATGALLSSGGYGISNLMISSTAPTISAAGTSPSVLVANGSASFRVDVGTGGTATGFTITFQAASNRWICSCQNATTNTTVGRIVQTGYSTTTCVMEQRTATTNAALAFAAGDDVDCIAIAQ